MEISPICYAVRSYIKSLSGNGTRTIKAIRGGAAMELHNIRIINCNTAMVIGGSGTIDADDLCIEDCDIGIEYVPNKAKGKSMALDITRSNFKDIGTVLRAPESLLVKIDDCNFEKIQLAFDIYIPEYDLEKLGLPRDIPQDLLLEAAKLIRDNKDKSEGFLVELIAESRLGKWLNFSSGVLTVATTIIGVIQYFS